MLAINTFSVADIEARELLPRIVRCGFEGLGVYSAHARELERDPSISASLPLVGYYVEFVAPVPRNDAVETFRIVLERCVRLGRPPLVVVPSADWRRVGGTAALAARLRLLAELAVERGVPLALEPLSRSLSHVTSLHDVATTVALLSDLPGDVGWIADLTHLEPEEVHSLAAASVKQIKSVHVADLTVPGDESTRVLPGLGRLPLRSLCDHLRAQGYAGWWELELTQVRFEGLERMERFLDEGLARLNAVVRT